MTKERARLESENSQLRLELALLIGADFERREVSRLRDENAKLQRRLDAERRMLAEMYAHKLRDEA